MSENRYHQYLPKTVSGLKEFQKLGEIEGVILEEEAAAKDSMIKNQWIITAERNGLLRFAKIAGITGAEGMETEALRQEILYRWSCRTPYTYFHLLNWLDGYCGAEQYQALLYREEYRLRLILELTIKEKKRFLETHLRKMIPANITLQVDLNMNTHGKLRIMTHGRMNACRWTYGGIPFEDLKPYQQKG